MTIKLEVLGGCGEYGRNCFYIEVAGEAILLDCGIMNDASKQLPDLTKNHIARLKGVFISHLHTDHTGALPFLEELGYHGTIITSDTTADWLGLENKQLMLIETSTKRKWQSLTKNIQFLWGYSGHVIGSLWFSIRLHGICIFYSGDFSFQPYITKLNCPPKVQYDLALIEGGNADGIIDNSLSLVKFSQKINQDPQQSFYMELTFSNKLIDILLYLYETSSRTLILDQEVWQWLEFHIQHSTNLMSDKVQSLKKLMESSRVYVDVRCESSIYFFKKSTSKLSDRRMSDEVHEIKIDNHQHDSIPYKTHLDNYDIQELTSYIDGTKVVYFHSKWLTEQDGLTEIKKLIPKGVY
ncbi:MBL fold metallo-hydrolase [Carnobacterium gallinarum]|uniref:MBL fold metallo-hydrolase n=1 Tax=Carnobacterium gallinarum TaxID=2749 RepID=UPI0005599A0D|nr:MBL fold metallo-hydrolase [Carnobacterium gallinarum]